MRLQREIVLDVWRKEQATTNGADRGLAQDCRIAPAEQKQRLQQFYFLRCSVFRRKISNRCNLLTFQWDGKERDRKRTFGSATGNRTRVLRLRISRPNP